MGWLCVAYKEEQIQEEKSDEANNSIFEHWAGERPLEVKLVEKKTDLNLKKSLKPERGL